MISQLASFSEYVKNWRMELSSKSDTRALNIHAHTTHLKRHTIITGGKLEVDDKLQRLPHKAFTSMVG